MINTAIILAGGKGTRLQSVVQDLPKPMAPINGRPFLAILLDRLNDQGVSRVILSVGYKHETIMEHFGHQYRDITISYAIEDEPLGTGGGVKLAAQLCPDPYFLLINGDTMFDIDIQKLVGYHLADRPSISIALHTVENQDRYGQVELDCCNNVVSFTEKKHIEKGHINGGVYIFDTFTVLNSELPEAFSLEKDILENKAYQDKMKGYPMDGYFIDIGIPEDYSRAQDELS